MSQPVLTMVCPPRHAYDDVVMREGNARQVWKAVRLDAHQLDYWSHENLWPGWRVFENAGRYLSEHTMRVLNYWSMMQPEPKCG